MKPAISLYPILCVFMLFVLSSCSGNKDNVIKADLSTKAKEEKDFAGVSFMVENGIVILNGECATQKSKNNVESMVKKLYGVKDVKNNIIIAPVIIGTDQLLKESVDSIAKQYASVEAITKDSIVYLKGKIDRDKFDKLTDAIMSLNPKMVDNSLIMK